MNWVFLADRRKPSFVPSQPTSKKNKMPNSTPKFDPPQSDYRLLRSDFDTGRSQNQHLANKARGTNGLGIELNTSLLGDLHNPAFQPINFVAKSQQFFVISLDITREFGNSAKEFLDLFLFGFLVKLLIKYSKFLLHVFEKFRKFVSCHSESILTPRSVS